MPNPSIMPIHLSINIDTIKNFIEKDPDPIICFYGGDPLYRIDLVKRIMDEIKASHYIIQTNGIMLHKLNEEYLKRIDTLLVSIDGRPEVTDYYRGEGIYDRVIRNTKIILKKGFKGDLVARMTISGKSDVYKDVKHLVELDDPKFTHVHWQLDALWDYPPAQRYDNFARWVKYNYNPGIDKLIRYWMKNMEDGYVAGIAPFKGLMWSMLTGENKNILRCGSGDFAFAIGTDGRILACPIAPEFKFNLIGYIDNLNPADLPGRVKINGICRACEYYEYCGGRCLFSNKTMLWGLEGFKTVCSTVKHLIKRLLGVKDRVWELINENIIDLNELRYPPYPNTVEIIP